MACSSCLKALSLDSALQRVLVFEDTAFKFKVGQRLFRAHRVSGLLGFLTEKCAPCKLRVLVSEKGIFPLSVKVWGKRTLPGVRRGLSAPVAMGPQLPFLVAALASCLLPARACLMCATKVVEALDSLEKDYLPDHLPAESHGSFMKRVKDAVLDFKNLPIHEESYMGVLGEGREERRNPESWERRGLWLG